jgi:ABC-type multidrug transport system fused ATPase/permease subunit
MVKSILVVEIYRKATVARIDTSRDSAALTLMSTDMERINMGLRSIHDIWASLIQVALASWMLYTQLGLVLFAPIALVLACVAALAVLMRLTGDSQRAWMAKVQERVGLTSTVISSMKSLKLSGLSRTAQDFVQKLRVDELAAGTRFRTISILAALLGFLPLLMGPPLMFAFSKQEMDATKIYTSLSYLLLLTNPLTQIFQSVPELLSGLACLGRVQAFLQEADREDGSDAAGNCSPDDEKLSEKDSSETVVHKPQSIRIHNGTFGWQPGNPTLHCINTTIPGGSITTVVGPVGSGKSTLCQAILGEVPFKEGQLLLDVQPCHIGYCHQTPFLSNETIRHNIVGFCPFDPARYSEVIEAAALTTDLRTLPQGDTTKVGSDGITLSGGQKQRIALARALYVHTNLIILDDIFSGLDADTEDQITWRVFGPEGLLRRRNVTTILCTHSSKQLALADHIIALQAGRIIEQGSWTKLLAGSSYVSGLMLGAEAPNSSPLTRTMLGDAEHKTNEYSLEGSYVAETPSVPCDNTGSRQGGDWTVYKQYFKSMGLTLAISSLGFAVLWGFFTNFSTVCEYLNQRRHQKRKVDYTNFNHYRAQVLVR